MAGKKPKIDIIRIGLDGLDVEAELVLANDVPKTDFSGIKVKVIKPKDPLEGKAKFIADKLADMSKAGLSEAGRFMTKEMIIQDAGITDDQFNRLISKVQSYLRHEDKWALQKLKKKSVQYYYVIQFS